MEKAPGLTALRSPSHFLCNTLTLLECDAASRLERVGLPEIGNNAARTEQEKEPLRTRYSPSSSLSVTKSCSNSISLIDHGSLSRPGKENEKIPLSRLILAHSATCVG
jgi:hypothetical protein